MWGLPLTEFMFVFATSVAEAKPAGSELLPGQWYDPWQNQCHNHGQIWTSDTAVSVGYRGLERVDTIYTLYNWFWSEESRRYEFKETIPIYQARAEHRADLRMALGQETEVDVVTRGRCTSYAWQPVRVRLNAPFPELDPANPEPVPPTEGGGGGG